MVVHVGEALDGAALLPLDQYLDGPVRQLQQLQYGGDRTNAIQRVLGRIVVRRILLRNQQDLLVAGHGGLEGFDGFLTANE